MAFQVVDGLYKALLGLYICCVIIRGVDCWPEGTYGLPMTDSGCPISENLYWNHGSRSQTTEDGSYASEGTHLAGFINNKKTDHITQNFCMKTSVLKTSLSTWGEGLYCIYKKGACPTGLRKGSVFWADDVSILDWSLDKNLQYQTHSGELPDGEYTYTTRIEFCCRTDGSVTRAIELPTDYAFYLLRLGNQCQKVKDMDVFEESVQWAGNQGVDRNHGSHPVLSQTPSYIRMYYCYYTPQTKSNILKIIIILIVVLTCLAIFFVVVTFIIQRIWAWHSSKKKGDSDQEVESADISAQQTMLAQNRSNEGHTGAIYRPKVTGGGASAAEGEELMATAPPTGHDSRPISLPPSYEEVLRQDSQENNI